MSRTLLDGDMVLVEKLSFGPRMPASPFEIPWVNFITFFNNNKDGWDYYRLNGLTSLKHNHIVVYNAPGNERMPYIKRCIGLPGDTLEIEKTITYINGTKLPFPSQALHLSRITYGDYENAIKVFDSLDVWRRPSTEKDLFVQGWVNDKQKESLTSKDGILSIAIEKERPDTSYTIYPGNPYYAWSLDDFGPVVVPYKGMEIELNKENYILYQKVLNSSEEVKITNNNKLFQIDGQPASTYIFKKNYYFMMGDHRHASSDSRMHGFIPEDNIIGKAAIVLYSHKKWGRIFKRNFD